MFMSPTKCLFIQSVRRLDILFVLYGPFMKWNLENWMMDTILTWNKTYRVSVRCYGFKAIWQPAFRWSFFMVSRLDIAASFSLKVPFFKVKFASFSCHSLIFIEFVSISLNLSRFDVTASFSCHSLVFLSKPLFFHSICLVLMSQPRFHWICLVMMSQPRFHWICLVLMTLPPFHLCCLVLMSQPRFH